MVGGVSSTELASFDDVTLCGEPAAAHGWSLVSCLLSGIYSGLTLGCNSFSVLVHEYISRNLCAPVAPSTSCKWHSWVSTRIFRRSSGVPGALVPPVVEEVGLVSFHKQTTVPSPAPAPAPPCFDCWCSISCGSRMSLMVANGPSTSKQR